MTYSKTITFRIADVCPPTNPLSLSPAPNPFGAAQEQTAERAIFTTPASGVLAKAPASRRSSAALGLSVCAATWLAAKSAHAAQKEFPAAQQELSTVQEWAILADKANGPHWLAKGCGGFSAGTLFLIGGLWLAYRIRYPKEKRGTPIFFQHTSKEVPQIKGPIAFEPASMGTLVADATRSIKPESGFMEDHLASVAIVGNTNRHNSNSITQLLSISHQLLHCFAHLANGAFVTDGDGPFYFEPNFERLNEPKTRAMWTQAAPECGVPLNTPVSRSHWNKTFPDQHIGLRYTLPTQPIGAGYPDMRGFFVGDRVYTKQHTRFEPVATVIGFNKDGTLRLVFDNGALIPRQSPLEVFTQRHMANPHGLFSDILAINHDALSQSWAAKISPNQMLLNCDQYVSLFGDPQIRTHPIGPLLLDAHEKGLFEALARASVQAVGGELYDVYLPLGLGKTHGKAVRVTGSGNKGSGLAILYVAIIQQAIFLLETALPDKKSDTMDLKTLLMAAFGTVFLDSIRQPDSDGDARPMLDYFLEFDKYNGITVAMTKPTRAGSRNNEQVPHAVRDTEGHEQFLPATQPFVILGVTNPRGGGLMTVRIADPKTGNYFILRQAEFVKVFGAVALIHVDQLPKTLPIFESK